MKGKTRLPDTSVDGEAEDVGVGQMANEGGQCLVTVACCNVLKELGRTVSPAQAQKN